MEKQWRRAAPGREGECDMATFGQEVVDAAERAYRDLGAISLKKRQTWEALDQVQKDTFALMWFAGFLAGRAQSNSSSAPQMSN